MKLTNSEIYNYANALLNAFAENDRMLPIKINFYLQKNKKTLVELAKDIETNRTAIARTYGTPDETGTQFSIDPEKIPVVEKELEDLFSLEQEVNIYKINIDSFDEDLMLTTAQMEAMMFMID